MHRHIITARHSNGSTYLQEFDNEDDASEYMNFILLGLVSDNYKVDRIEWGGAVVYSKGYWFWKKEVFINWYIYQA